MDKTNGYDFIYRQDVIKPALVGLAGPWIKVRLYNRTPLTQTFLWWANVATRVHERYQSFFPPDVYYVADHAKRATSRFPRCDGKYYGVDYAARGRDGVPAHETPRQFVPPAGEYSPDDLSWYANIPVPTSYMCMDSRGDFFGGYDHAARAGIVHVASHHISPGKKQWTWRRRLCTAPGRSRWGSRAAFSRAGSSAS